MAKVGEGDPRWLVEERPDGTNVNNWHWTEKDCLPWTKKRLPELLENLACPADDKVEYCKTTKLDTVSGEATINSRKGKIFFFYELEIKVEWEGKVNGNATVYKGKVIVPNLSEENDDDDFEVKVTYEGEAAESQTLKSAVQKSIVPPFREKIKQYLQELRSVQTAKILKTPKPNSSSSSSQASSKQDDQKQQKQEPKASRDQKTIRMRVEFRCGKKDLFETLMTPQRVMAFTQSPATIAPVVGCKFNMFGGSVQGEVTDLAPPEKIVQKWRFATWPEGHFSTVTISLNEEETGTTILNLVQTGVPYDDADRTEQGWKNYFWERIKMVFGYPYQMKKI